MNSREYRIIEFLILFIVIPIAFCFDFSLWIKAMIAVFGFIYIIYVLVIIEGVKRGSGTEINRALLFRSIVLRFIVIIILSTAFVYLYNPEQMFIVFKNKPLMWFALLLVYSIFSVYPQELIYRTFFFSRYKNLLKHNNALILINALIFSLAHLFFKNSLVLVMTFVGGILFASSFLNHKSTLMVSIEHALYGCWLFTLGLGSIMGFPD